MKKAALIVAVEMKAVFSLWGKPEKVYENLPFKACSYCRNGRQIFVIRSGPGQLAAAAAAQMAVSLFGAAELWNFGVAGGLVPAMQTGDVCVVSGVIHYDTDVDRGLIPVAETLPEKEIRLLQINDESELWTEEGTDARAPETGGLIRIHTGITAASGDRVVARPDRRIELAQRTGAQVVEMEGAAVALTAARNGVPCYMVKGISDDLDTPDDELTAVFVRASERTLRVMDALMIKKDEWNGGKEEKE